METSLVLTIIGRDRPGLVERVSQTIAEHGGSWQESRMARLAGRFAGVLLVSVEAEQAAGLSTALEGLDASELRVVVEPSGGESAAAAESHRGLALTLVGQDRPGIIRDISAALAERGVNVVELETHVSSAPMSADLLFHASAQLRSPSELSVDDLRETLERIADDLMVEIQLGDEGETPS